MPPSPDTLMALAIAIGTSLFALDMLSLKLLWDMRGEETHDYTARTIAGQAEETAEEALQKAQEIRQRFDQNKTHGD